ncbi:MAG: type II secretion system minor pseudopilin GspJ [Gammaproteobacteria bacterium]|nr:type II secretion system minor pseudopilin GspJ [Gammaproteobacteria bacterium]
MIFRQSKNRGNKYSGGFTLIELLVAVLVFAVISALASGGFNAVLKTASRSEAQMTRLAELQKAMVIIARDVEQAVERPVRDGFGDTLPPFIGSQPTNLLEFSRTGRGNPGQVARSHLQRIGYRYEEDILYRLSWAVLDRAQDTEPNEYELIKGINEIEIRYLDSNREWQDQWPPLLTSPGTSNALPHGIEITLDIEGLGSVPRIFRIRGFS